MKHTVTHPLTRDAARTTLDRMLQTYGSHYAEHDVRTAWADDDTATIAFQVGRRTVEGRVAVRDDCYELDVDLPFLLRPFQGRIARAVDEEVAKWLDATSGGRRA